MYGICNLSIVPLRAESTDQSEMVSQVLFGECFTILEKNKNWSKIKLSFDEYEGFIDNKQFEEISEELFHKISHQTHIYAGEVIDYITDVSGNLLTIPLGAHLPFYENQHFSINEKKFQFEGKVFSGAHSKNEIIQTAFIFLNTPYLWGGKTPFGIDCSGFTQMIYKLCGHKLFRDAHQQAKQGEVLSFIEESEPGDLAFFDNEEGEIIHVGIILKDYHIIHAYGKVRIDTLDHSGIFNNDLHTHTHKLRVIKKLI
ncbi:hydrolase Nlp/P60 [Polaribacter reichenbachii]|uniref:Hydrolase Nlp/P60 n=1 Tax=Polaribacter reichenbachii TaxID=996801 RepID=A0A1B8TQ90_9FLAO|nr:C40 family peptidase [Polaribacter reichenbachii]APZ46710.1 hydrolase Nlp/P60 [Polaribacter reichenbachii]AUC17353.1 hydrolase Nlp/P60 [Polaribacter reichenbachii]OBY61771.1 hydrolase Nlp/P60 [Polaribacter reichenbachii]